ncbi:MAG: 50S ribosomal protein L17 [Planctomycetes bacterium]|nr:50S ribosomal protein L17 [Planctomycetota bacterium]
MRHRVSGKTLNRTSAHRKAMRRNLAIALFQHGAIRTTEAKAKDLKPFVERLISHARKGTVHARRLISAELGNRRGDRGVLMDDEGNPQDKGLLDVLFDDIAPRYADRPGGYTRIIRLAERRLGDAGRQVVLQLVEEAGAGGGQGGSRGSRRKRRAEARHEAVAAVGAEGEAAAPQPAEPRQADEDGKED